jgi:hypothetical protein
MSADWKLGWTTGFLCATCLFMFIWFMLGVI